MVVHDQGSRTGTVTDLDTTLAALAEPSRRAVIGLLKGGPRRSSELAEQLSLSRPAMSRHLKVLRQAGLVTETSPDDDARVRMYELAVEPFSQLRSWVEEVEAFWGDQLASFRAHAEAGARRRKR